MTSTHLNESSIKEVAAGLPHTQSEIEGAIEAIHEMLQETLLQQYEDAYLNGGINHHLFDTTSEAWFAFSRQEIHIMLSKNDVEVPKPLVAAALHANQHSFHRNGWRVTITAQIADKRTDPYYYPVLISKPEKWLEGKQRVMQQLEELMFRYEMSPVEAIDYWAVELMNRQSEDWAQIRGVGGEAIRKNLRSAREALADEELGRTHPVNQIRVAEERDIPDDGIYDEQSNQYFMLSYEESETIREKIDD